MSRHVIRTHLLHPDTAAAIRGLFGTMKNAYRKLGIHDFAFSEFQAALSLEAVRMETTLVIEYQWLLWRKEFLRDPDDQAFPELEQKRRHQGHYFSLTAQGDDGRPNGSAQAFDLPPLKVEGKTMLAVIPKGKIGRVRMGGLTADDV